MFQNGGIAIFFLNASCQNKTLKLGKQPCRYVFDNTRVRRSCDEELKSSEEITD